MDGSIGWEKGNPADLFPKISSSTPTHTERAWEKILYEVSIHFCPVCGLCYVFLEMSC